MLAMIAHALLLTIQPVQFKGDCVVLDAKAPKIETSDYTFNLKLSDADAKAFAELTKANVGGHVAMALDGKIFMVPKVREPITGPNVQVTLGDAVGFEAVKTCK